MSTEQLPVEDCDHLGSGWCEACRPPHDDDEPLAVEHHSWTGLQVWWDHQILR